MRSSGSASNPTWMHFSRGELQNTQEKRTGNLKYFSDDGRLRLVVLLVEAGPLPVELLEARRAEVHPAGRCGKHSELGAQTIAHFGLVLRFTWVWAVELEKCLTLTYE